MHRIISVEEVDGQRVFRTKGDANEGADPWELRLTGEGGRLVFVAPYAGYLLWFFKTRAAWSFVVLPLAAYLGFAGPAAGCGSVRQARSRENASPMRTAFLVLALALFVVAAGLAGEAAGTFSDQASVSNNAFTTASCFPTWWDASYLYRRQLTVTTGAAGVDGGYSVMVTLNHASLVGDSKSQSTATTCACSPELWWLHLVGARPGP